MKQQDKKRCRPWHISFYEWHSEKKNTLESVMEELEWVVNELNGRTPGPVLLAAVKEEFLSGDYLAKRGAYP